ncbi:hypothetical protein VTO73DRAFT_10943 [Trametes versicolor]
MHSMSMFNDDNDDGDAQFIADAHLSFSTERFVDQTVPCDTSPASSPDDSWSSDANCDDAMNPTSPSASPGYSSNLDDPGPRWHDHDPALSQDAQAAPPSFDTFGAFPGAGPPANLLPLGERTDWIYVWLASLDDAQLHALRQAVGGWTPQPVAVDPPARQQGPPAASLERSFNTYVVFPNDSSTPLPHPGWETTSKSSNDDPRAHLVGQSSLLPIQGMGDWTIRQPVHVGLAPARQDYAGHPRFELNPPHFHCPSGNPDMPLRPTVSSPSDNSAFTEPEDQEAPYHPMPHREPLPTFSSGTTGDTSMSPQSLPVNGTYSPDPGYLVVAPSLPSPMLDWHSPSGAPFNPPGAPVFTIVEKGDRTYKTSQEYEGDHLIVWYYCSHDYPDCPKLSHSPGNHRRPAAYGKKEERDLQEVTLPFFCVRRRPQWPTAEKYAATALARHDTGSSLLSTSVPSNAPPRRPGPPPFVEDPTVSSRRRTRENGDRKVNACINPRPPRFGAFLYHTYPVSHETSKTAPPILFLSHDAPRRASAITTTCDMFAMALQSRMSLAKVIHVYPST